MNLMTQHHRNQGNNAERTRGALRKWNCWEPSCPHTFESELAALTHLAKVHNRRSVHIFINGQRIKVRRTKNYEEAGGYYKLLFCPVVSCQFSTRDAFGFKRHCACCHPDGEVTWEVYVEPSLVSRAFENILEWFGMSDNKNKTPTSFGPRHPPVPKAGRISTSEDPVPSPPYFIATAAQPPQANYYNHAAGISYNPMSLNHNASSSTNVSRAGSETPIPPLIAVGPLSFLDPAVSNLESLATILPGSTINYSTDFFQGPRRIEDLISHPSVPITTPRVTTQPLTMPLESPRPTSTPSTGTFAGPAASNITPAYQAPAQPITSETQPPAPTLPPPTSPITPEPSLHQNTNANTPFSPSHKRARTSSPVEDTIEQARREARRKVHELGEKMLSGLLNREEMVKVQEEIDLIVAAKVHYLRALRLIEEF